jgi:hypothetical protein
MLSLLCRLSLVGSQCGGTPEGGLTDLLWNHGKNTSLEYCSYFKIALPYLNTFS